VLLILLVIKGNLLPFALCILVNYSKYELSFNGAVLSIMRFLGQKTYLTDMDTLFLVF